MGEGSPRGFRSGDYLTLFLELFRHSSDTVYLSRLADGVILDVNDSFLRLFGRRREEVVGRTRDAIGIWGRLDELWELEEGLRTKGLVEDYRASMRGRWSEEFTLSITAVVTEWRGQDVILGMGRVVVPRRPELAPQA